MYNLFILFEDVKVSIRLYFYRNIETHTGGFKIQPGQHTSREVDNMSHISGLGTQGKQRGQYQRVDQESSEKLRYGSQKGKLEKVRSLCSRGEERRREEAHRRRDGRKRDGTVADSRSRNSF